MAASIRTPGPRSERGAAAILFALLASVLFGVGAFAVDIGHAYAKRSLEQTDVDVAVMAAAAELTTGGACNQQVIDTATDYLTRATNAVPGQYPINLGGTEGDKDGFIRCDHWRVDLWAPSSRVDFALAGTIPGAPDGLDVNAHAAAQFKAAPTSATLPFFAVDGCDSGQQSLRNDSSTPTTPPVPTTLVPDTSSHNDLTFTSTPDAVDSGTTSATITIKGKLTNVDTVGFSNATGGYYPVTITKITSNGNVTVDVPVPSHVFDTEDTWYVRVRTADGRWSVMADAKPFRVGPPKLYCDASNQGNFGTIKIPRTEGNPGSWLELNMIKGVEPTLGIHPLPSNPCDGKSGSIESTSTPVNGTNCVKTDTGLMVSSTNAGLISGSGSYPGRLNADSTSGCSRNHNNGRTSAGIKIGPTTYQLNDDLLSCFITNGAHISDLVAGNTTGTEALSADIYKSPRFFWVPVLDTDPVNGTKSWPIIRFTPGFITDQSTSATHAAPGTISDFNGLVTESSGIREVKVVLFSEKALPPFAPPVGGEADYTGSGPKTLVLVE